MAHSLLHHLTRPARTLLAMRSLRDDPHQGRDDPATLYWSAVTGAIREIPAHGNVLAVGSGRTTLALGAAASASGRRVTVIEPDPRWADRVRMALRRVGLTETVTVVPAWRDALHHGPFAVVVDAEIARLAELRPMLATGADLYFEHVADREAQMALAAWALEIGARAFTNGTERPHTVVGLPLHAMHGPTR